jgi:hypothetical protein
LKAEGKKKRSESSAMKLSLQNGKRGIKIIFHVTATRIIPFRKEKNLKKGERL